MILILVVFLMGNVNKFMKYILIFTITIILNSCSKISDEELSKNRNYWKDESAKCLLQMVRKYDDGTSDTIGLSRAVISMCQEPIDKYDEWRVYGAGSIYRNAFYSARMEGWEKSALRFIYEERAK